MDEFSSESLATAKEVTRMVGEAHDKVRAVISVDDHLTGLALYLGAAIGPRETAMRLYRLADWMAGQKEAAE